jgi:hypothetical protein
MRHHRHHINLTIEGDCYVFRDEDGTPVGYCHFEHYHHVPKMHDQLVEHSHAGHDLPEVELPDAAVDEEVIEAAQNPYARRNFFGFGKKQKEAEAVSAKAQSIAQGDRASNYIVFGPNIHGSGQAWYLLSSLSARDFVQAPNSLVPNRLWAVDAGTVPEGQFNRLINEVRSLPGDVIIIDTVYGGKRKASSLQSLR